MPSFIVEFWSSIFGVLAKVSVFTLVRKLFPTAITARFVDCWVLSHLVPFHGGSSGRCLLTLSCDGIFLWAMVFFEPLRSSYTRRMSCCSMSIGS